MSTGLTYKYFTIRIYYIYIALTCISIYLYFWTVVSTNVNYMQFQYIPMQLVSAHLTAKFISDLKQVCGLLPILRFPHLRQVCGLLPILRFPQPIDLTATR